MKSKLLLSALLSFSFYLLSSQVPQGFNYQAIATDGGVPITSTLPVRITIQSLETGGTTFWIEEHANVTPNANGLFSIVVGTGTKVTGSAVNTFADIDWRITPKYIKTEINYGGWKSMGASKLQSVPYSMVAKNLDGPVDKLGVKGITTNMEEALFEVKNAAGQTVFAVYNEGVRIYVDDGDAKGTKGGFAIGGFDITKGGTPGQELFVVDPASIRMYIDKSAASKASKGGFAIGGFGGAKGDVQTYMRITNDTTKFFINDDPLQKGSKGGFAIGGFGQAKGVKNFFSLETDAAGTSIINPSENRMLFHPLKNAFLVGRVLITDINNVGENSFVSGFESMAKGAYSQSLGYKTKALGDYSTAIGKNASADATNSFAFGDGAQSTNIDSYAFGAGALASGRGSFSFGSFGRDTATYLPTTQLTDASGDYAFAIGLGAKSSGNSSTAIGIQSNASGDAAMALGVASRAEGEKSMAIVAGLATGRYSFASGLMSKAAGDYSVAIGRGITKFGGVYNLASGYGSIALGYSRVYGMNSIGIGIADVGTSTLDCNYGVAIGNSVHVNGVYAVAIGRTITANSYASFVIGNNNIISGNTTSWVSTDPIFVIGNGTTTPSNAMTVLKNGYTGIGVATPTQVLDVNGNARFRGVASGATSTNLYLTADGTLTASTSDISFKEEISTLTNSLNSVMNLRGVSFLWKSEPEMGRRIGFIAQEVEQVIPELVFTNPFDGYKGVNYAEMTALLVEGMKEQQKQINTLQEENQILKEQTKEISTLKSELEEIKAMLKKNNPLP
jgi:hypothetical protein